MIRKTAVAFMKILLVARLLGMAFYVTLAEEIASARAPFEDGSKSDFSVCAKNKDLNVGLNLAPRTFA